jgi:hypothetical protein
MDVSNFNSESGWNDDSRVMVVRPSNSIRLMKAELENEDSDAGESFVVAISLAYLFLVFLVWVYRMCFSDNDHDNQTGRRCVTTIHSEMLIKQSLVMKTVSEHCIPCFENPYLAQGAPRMKNEDAALQLTYSVPPPLNESFAQKEDNAVEANYTNALECPICFEPFEVGNAVSWAKKENNCRHVFHSTCLIQWLKRHDECPCCRRKILCSTYEGLAQILKIYHSWSGDVSIESGTTFCIVHGLITSSSNCACGAELSKKQLTGSSKKRLCVVGEKYVEDDFIPSTI